MKIVDRKTFLALPAETLFSKYEPCVFGDLCIKGESIGEIDFFYQQLADAIDCHDSGEMFGKLDAAEKCGASVALDLECQGRDGMFDADQLFAVWEPADVAQLIARLSKCALGVATVVPAQPWLTPREVEVLREIRINAKFDGLNEGWQRDARNLLLGLERFYANTAAEPERLQLTDAEAMALQRTDAVRSALLDYFERPCDKEAVAVVKAVAAQFTTLTAPRGVSEAGHQTKTAQTPMGESKAK